MYLRCPYDFSKTAIITRHAIHRVIQTTADWLRWGIFFWEISVDFRQNIDHNFLGKMGCRLSERCSCALWIDVRYWTVITAKQGRAIKLGESKMATNTVRVDSVLQKTELIAVQGWWRTAKLGGVGIAQGMCSELLCTGACKDRIMLPAPPWLSTRHA